MKTKPKVLLITGIHGNEERTILIAEELIKKYPKLQDPGQFDIDIVHLNSGFKQRDVQFNLNRIDQVELLKTINTKIQTIITSIKNYDIVLDLHNSEICSNKLLVSYQKDLPDWYVYNKKYLNDVIWRKSDFVSISEYARQCGKISFTVEFGGMVSQTQKVPKNDLKFLKRAIKLSSKIFEYEKQIKREVRQKGELGEFKLFDEFNQLLTLKLKESQLLFPDQIITNNKIEHTINGIYNDNFIVICPESNYGTVFEGTKVRLKERLNLK